MRRLITPLAVGALAASFAVFAAATPRACADCGTIPIETDGDGFGQYDDRQLPPDNEEWLPPDNDGWLPPNNDGWLPPDNEGRLPPDNDGWLPPDNDGWLPPGDEGWEDARDSRGHPILKVKVQEPTQNAVIGWNGVEQIMVLKTQLRATHKVKMMEIMPVPARPTVTEGDPQLFDKAMRLFESKHGLRPIVMAPKAGGPGATIIEEVQIGNHHIAVAQVVDPGRFVAWANDYVKNRVGDNARPAFSEMGKRIIAEYLRERYTYWIFDLIDLDTQMREHVAIQYRFPTTYLYYPMRITRTSGTGNTHVQLLVFTRELLGYFRGLDQNLIETPRPSVDVLPQELRNLNAELADLFGSRPVRLRLWELKGPIQSFQGDLQAKARLGSHRVPVRPLGGDRSRPPESSAVRPSARTEDSTARSQMDRPGSTKEPDLVIRDLYLDENRQVVVEVENLGPGSLSEELWTDHHPKSCGIQLFRNGKRWGGAAIWAFDPDKALQPPGGMATYTSRLRVSSSVTVTASVDATEQIREANESNNELSKKLGNQGGGLK